MKKSIFKDMLLKYTAAFLLFILPFPGMADSWIAQLMYPGGPRTFAVGFAIGKKGYIGTGVKTGGQIINEDFWEWDPGNAIWTQKADFGGGPRQGAAGFSIGNKGYVGTGDFGSLKKDFWEYDPVLNTWTQKASFGGSARWLANGFSIGSKGYIGFGTFTGNSSGSSGDFWEWEGDTASANYNTWVQKSNLPGNVRRAAFGFSIGTKGYVGTGAGLGPQVFNDFWEWDQATNVWTQKASYGGGPCGGATSFVLNGLGYCCGGNDGTTIHRKELWAYDPMTNNWIQKLGLTGEARSYAVGIAIGNRGYIALGLSQSWWANDLWEYCDSCTTVGLEDINVADFNVWYDPVGQQIHLQSDIALPLLQLTVYDLQGKICLQKNIRIDAHQPFKEIFSATPGVYLIVVADAKNKLSRKIWVR